jgi:hypothetical protein
MTLQLLQEEISTTKTVHTEFLIEKILGKVMIIPSLGSSALHGAARGATFGGVNIDDDKSRFTDVAVAYLAKDRVSQTCKIIEGKLLVTPQWEFIFFALISLDLHSVLPPAQKIQKAQSTYFFDKHLMRTDWRDFE